MLGPLGHERHGLAYNSEFCLRPSHNATRMQLVKPNIAGAALLLQPTGYKHMMLVIHADNHISYDLLYNLWKSAYFCGFSLHSGHRPMLICTIRIHNTIYTTYIYIYIYIYISAWVCRVLMCLPRGTVLMEHHVPRNPRGHFPPPLTYMTRQHPLSNPL
jgi:hypothetical protein